MADFSHLDATGKGQMVDVSTKQLSERLATVSGQVQVTKDIGITSEILREIATTARVAGVSAAKRTDELIPYCHQVPLSKVTVEVEFSENVFRVAATVKCIGVTGCEMEAFTAATVASLTIYDMVKAKDPAAVLGSFRLERKSGGKLGNWQRS